MSLALAYVASLLSLLFAASLLAQRPGGRQAYHVLWAVALLLFSVSMGLWFLRETFGLNQWIFRLWYLSGGMLAAAYLGTGMLYMVAPRPVANAFMGYLLVVTVAAVVLVLTAHIKTPADCLEGLKGLECLLPSETMTKMGFFPPWIRILGATLNAYGGLAVVAAVLWVVGGLVREEGRLRAEENARRAAEEADARPFQRYSPVEAGDLVDRALASVGRYTLITGIVLLANWEFWRKDFRVQRAASNIIILIGIVLGGLGATLNIFESSAPHLGFFLVGVIIIYLGFLDMGAVLEALFRRRSTDSPRAATETGGTSLPFGS